jgi:hypothetical protein
LATMPKEPSSMKTEKPQQQDSALYSIYVRNVLHEMEKNMADVDLQIQSCWKIIGMLTDSDNDTKMLEGHGKMPHMEEAICTIMNSMMAHPKEAVVQIYGCLAFKYAANGSTSNSKLIRTSGALEVIIAALINHPNNVKLLGITCITFWEICFDFPSPDTYAASRDYHQPRKNAQGTHRQGRFAGVWPWSVPCGDQNLGGVLG